ncbi:MAG TPA: two-component regulator propeller domain-containing protein [Verrucomicrobiae bacterium]|nr:two-component regulator propeller domain-containing protein [Verrucomicrobiae bacterium]
MLFCTSLWSLAADGVNPEYLIKNWTTADGLPENTVRAIIETRDGYLWMGTANGLARFDGVRFTLFDAANTPEFFSANIAELAEDPQGGLWIRSGRGTFRLHEGRFQLMPRAHDGAPVTLWNFVRDANGELWMRAGPGLARWTGEKLEMIPVPDGPTNLLYISAAPEGGLWISAGNGLWRWREAKVRKVTDAPAAELIAASRDGRLWGVVGELRLVMLDQGRWSPVTDFGGERCSTLWTASNGDVWIGASSRNRAFRWRDGRLAEINSAQGLEGNRTICFTEDREGNVWVGVNGAGLYRLREKRVRVFNRDDGFQGLYLASVTEDANGTVLANVMGWTMHRFAGNRFEPLLFDGLCGPFQGPTALVPAKAGGVWAGTYSGALSRVIDGCIVERIGSDAGTRALFVDRGGELWRGTRTAGVEHFSGTNMTRYSTAEGLSFNNVYCFAQDRSGAVWVGTEEGLNRIENGNITRFSRTNGLGHHFVTALCADSHGMLWAGTLGGGLSSWDGAKFVTVTRREGLADDVVQQLIEDDYGFLWIGTRAGLMRVSLEHLHDFVQGRQRVIAGTLVGRNEGLIRPDCWTEYQPAGIKARDGRLWVSTSSGLALIDPRQFSKPAPAPIVHIEELTVDGKSNLEIGDSKTEILVPPGSQRLEIRYTGLSPSGPELIRFRYRLQDYDRDWVEAGRTRFASYARVPPGRYAFQVRAMNNDGLWNESDAALALVVEPAFWQTAWFRGALVLMFAGVLFAAYRTRITQLERRRRAQEAFSRQLIESQEQERKRIAGELHDSLGQNLLVIKNRAALALTQRDDPQKMAEQVGEVSAMTSAAIREVRDIAQNLRPFQIDELGLTKSIAAVARKLGDASGIEFRTDLDDIDGALPPEFEINFYRIVQECLNNVAKHSQAKTASIVLRREQRTLRLTVQDDGRGFAARREGHSEARGFGLKNITERARTMGGEVRIKSSPGEGTRVEVTIGLR